MTRAQLEWLKEMKRRIAVLEASIACMEHREAIVKHLVKHRVQSYLRGKLGNKGSV